MFVYISSLIIKSRILVEVYISSLIIAPLFAARRMTSFKGIGREEKPLFILLLFLVCGDPLKLFSVCMGKE